MLIHNVCTPALVPPKAGSCECSCVEKKVVERFMKVGATSTGNDDIVPPRHQLPLAVTSPPGYPDVGTHPSSRLRRDRSRRDFPVQSPGVAGVTARPHTLS